MRSFTTRFAAVAATAAALGWLLLSEHGAEQLARWLQPLRHNGQEVARIAQVEGTIKIVRGGRVEKHEAPLAAPLALQSGDRLEVDGKGKAVVVLNSKDELDFGALSAASFQLWDERDANSAVYVTWLAGEVTLRKAGIKGRAYIVREGRLYLPGQKATGRPLALTVLKNAPLDMRLGDEGVAPPHADPEPGAALAEPAATAYGAEPETLSNEYIDEVIVAKQNLLQKCWIARVRENPSLKATMTVQFQITRRGKVQDVRIVDSSLEDDALKTCVAQVFERLVFRSFKGAEISLSYPLQFE